jgi:hypothetical protein
LGYTHGTKWTDDLIKEKVLEVVAALELERMPSRKECEMHFQDGGLVNAISKRCGFYKLANQLGLPIKESETYFGKKQEAVAQEQLISMGYEVRRMSQNFPYDLLVNDCLKVDVKASNLYSGVKGNFYAFNLEKPFCTCDIYMLYLLNNDKTEKDVLIVPSVFVATNTQISVGEITSKYYKYSQRWDYIASYSEFLASVS